MIEQVVVPIVFAAFIAALVSALLMRHAMRKQDIPLAVASELTSQANRFVGAALALEEGGARRQLVACAHMLRQRATDLMQQEAEDGDSASNRSALRSAVRLL